MNKNINHFENEGECIQVEGGDVGRWGALVSGDPGPAVASAGTPSPERGEGVVDEDGYQVVTRARGKQKVNVKAIPKTVQPVVFHFDQPNDASKRRRAEDDLGDITRDTNTVEQIKGLKTLVLQLLEKEEQRTKEISELKQEVQELKKLVQKDNAGKLTYATVLKASRHDVQTAVNTGVAKAITPTQHHRLRAEDDKCSITINTTRFKGEKTDFVQVKAALQKGVDDSAVLQGAKIRCLRELPGERINVVFATEEEAEKARAHGDWLAAAMPEARLRSEEWYPVKCDMVVKRAVLDGTVEGGRTLRKEVCAEFAQDNCSDNIDFTAMKASWLSKIDPRKKTGSLVIWLKNKLAADYLLRTGQALFGGGAYGAFCSRYEPSTVDKLCFNCNAYGHLQGACRRAARCGKCSGAHQTWDCQNQGPLKCAVCAGQHRSSDWQCRRHPHHKRYLAAQARLAAENRPVRQSQDVEMDAQTSCQ